MIRKEEIEKSLKTNEGRAAALKKVNEQIEKVIKGITDNKKLTIVDSSSLKCKDQDEKAKNQFMYTVLKIFDPNEKYPCGLSGSIEERTKDCSGPESSVKGNFTLISRGKNFTEIYKDNKSGLIWSDRLPSKQTQYGAVSACEVLPDMNYLFWSSSVHPSYSDDGWMFSGYNGYAGDGYYSRSFQDSVRCVVQ